MWPRVYVRPSNYVAYVFVFLEDKTKQNPPCFKPGFRKTAVRLWRTQQDKRRRQRGNNQKKWEFRSFILKHCSLD